MACLPDLLFFLSLPLPKPPQYPISLLQLSLPTIPQYHFCSFGDHYQSLKKYSKTQMLTTTYAMAVNYPKKHFSQQIMNFPTFVSKAF